MISLGANLSKVALEMYCAFIWKVTGFFNVESTGKVGRLGRNCQYRRKLRNGCKILVLKSEGNFPFGKLLPKFMCIKRNNTSFKQVGCEGGLEDCWVKVAQGAVQRKDCHYRYLFLSYRPGNWSHIGRPAC